MAELNVLIFMIHSRVSYIYKVTKGKGIPGPFWFLRSMRRKNSIKICVYRNEEKNEQSL